MLNPDKSLDEIVRIRQMHRPQSLKRLRRGKFISFSGINTMEIRLNNARKVSDARLKINSTKTESQDLRKKIYFKNTNTTDSLEENNEGKFSPYIDKEHFPGHLNRENYSNYITGLPSYHETKKIQITIKGLNKPRKDADTALFGKALYYPNFTRNSSHHLEHSNQGSSSTYRNIFNHTNMHNSLNKEFIPQRHASQNFSVEFNKESHRATKLIISNLSSSVTHRDITELCQAIGRIESVFLHNCIAEVIFLNKASALEAYKTYHNRHLDGKAMLCRISSNYNLNSHASVPSRMENVYLNRRDSVMHPPMFAV